MTLVITIPNVTAKPGAKKFYPDVLVERGTLFLHDYSNTGMLNNFSIANGATIKDLAKLSAVEFGVNNQTTSTVNGTNNTLTAGKGLNPVRMGLTGSYQGFLFNDTLLKRLAAKNAKLVAIMWVRRVSQGAAAGRIINTFNATTNSLTDFRVSVASNSTGSLSMSFGNISSGTVPVYSPLGTLVQMAVEFVNPTTLRVFENGVYKGVVSGATGGGFSNDVTGFGIGRIESGVAPDTNLYRLLIEDLDVSGRTADVLVKKDFDYVTGTGEFAGKGARIFVNTP